jgi:hypothetical protein
MVEDGMVRDNLLTSAIEQDSALGEDLSGFC